MSFERLISSTSPAQVATARMREAAFRRGLRGLPADPPGDPEQRATYLAAHRRGEQRRAELDG